MLNTLPWTQTQSSGQNQVTLCKVSAVYPAIYVIIITQVLTSRAHVRPEACTVHMYLFKLLLFNNHWIWRCEVNTWWRFVKCLIILNLKLRQANEVWLLSGTTQLYPIIRLEEYSIGHALQGKHLRNDVVCCILLHLWAVLKWKHLIPVICVVNINLTTKDNTIIPCSWLNSSSIKFNLYFNLFSEVYSIHYYIWLYYSPSCILHIFTYILRN